MSQVYPEGKSAVNDSTRKTACTFSQKWDDDPFTALGHTQVPNALLDYGARIGLAPDECWLITCILSYKYTTADPYPGQDALAAKFGRSVDTVQRVTGSIRAKGLLKATRERNDRGHFSHIVYNFTALRAALNECYYQDHPQTRTKHSAPAPMPQECGVAGEKAPNKSRTARLRQGTPAVRPGRKKGAVHAAESGEAIPQGCGANQIPDKDFEGEQIKQEQATQAGADSQAWSAEEIVVDSLNSLFSEDQDENAVRGAFRQAEETVQVSVQEPVPAPDPAVRQAAKALAHATDLGLDTIEGIILKWRQGGGADADIALILNETRAVVARPPKAENPAGLAVTVLRSKIKQGAAKPPDRAAPQPGSQLYRHAWVDDPGAERVKSPKITVRRPKSADDGIIVAGDAEDPAQAARATLCVDDQPMPALAEAVRSATERPGSVRSDEAIAHNKAGAAKIREALVAVSGKSIEELQREAGVELRLGRRRQSPGAEVQRHESPGAEVQRHEDHGVLGSFGGLPTRFTLSGWLRSLYSSKSARRKSLRP